jgi:hypothetical protein
MKQRANQILYGYWNEVRAGRIAPRRFDVEPARIASILPDTFILEFNSPNQCRFRLAGTRICEQFGYELRNRDFFDLLPTGERCTFEHELAMVAQRGAVSLSEFETTTRDNQSARCEVLILPLTDPRGVITRFLGAMSCHQPNVFEPNPIRIKSLIRHELIWPEGRPHALLERAKCPGPFQSKPTPTRIVSSHSRRFRVFEGGRAGSEPGES